MEQRFVSDPFNPPPLEFEKHRSDCHCGDSGTVHVHDDEWGAATPVKSTVAEEQHIDRAVETTVLKTLFPKAAMRRNLLKAVGAGTLLSAIGQHFPLAAAQSIAKEAPKPEKSKLTLGFVPITCTVPMLLAQARGEYGKEGLNVSLVRTPGWPLVRDHLISGNYDASHLVLAMPLTMSIGVGSNRVKTYTSIVQNVNGDALAMHVKHKDKRDPRTWKGFRFGIPHQHSVHAMLLRYYLAEHGLDPEKDVELRVFPPPDSVANMAAGNLDGMFFAEPWNQRAVFEGVAYLQVLSADIFPGHPCCVLSVTEKFITENPNTYGALFRAVARAGAYADPYENRNAVAEALAPKEYLNQPLSVLQQVMLGRYADGLGNVVERRDRIGFQSFPYASTGMWLLTQLKRWNMVPKDVDVAAVARDVFRSADAERRLKELGIAVPGSAVMKHRIMGKEFDPANIEAYQNSFAIRAA